MLWSVCYTLQSVFLLKKEGETGACTLHPRVTVRGLSRFNGDFLKRCTDVHCTHLLEMVGPTAEAAIYTKIIVPRFNGFVKTILQIVG